MQRVVPPTIRKGAESEVHDILTEGFPATNRQIGGEYYFFQNSYIINCFIVTSEFLIKHLFNLSSTIKVYKSKIL